MLHLLQLYIELSVIIMLGLSFSSRSKFPWALMAHAFRAKTEAPARARPTTGRSWLNTRDDAIQAASMERLTEVDVFFLHVYSSMHTIFAIFLHCSQKCQNPTSVRQQLQHRQMTLPCGLDARPIASEEAHLFLVYEPIKFRAPIHQHGR